jgi:hypothetical protein
MALLKVCLGLVTAEHVVRKAAEVVVLMDFRSGDVKARAEEEYKASMHAKMGMNFMVVQAFKREIERIGNLWDQTQTTRNLK